MVAPCTVGAIRAVGVCASGGATALGIGMGKSDMDLSRELFKQQMRQAKRLWTADWAESSVRHGESTMQSAQHHSEAQAMATAAYYQAEKLAGQGIKLARDQDSRAYEMAWRAEVRESLRDELGNQNNRFNIIMLCDTVCLSCVFTLVADGGPPTETPSYMLNAYVACLGVSTMFFSISLWGSVLIMRRLHDNTAARLERKLFVESEDLQKTWQQQLQQNTPTGAQEIYLVHQAYERWISEFINPMGKMVIEMLSIGVITMFIAAGILIQSVYSIDYNNFAAVPTFWSCVAITCTAMLYMKLSEDRKEKKKEGVYSVSWEDENFLTRGPFAKIDKAADELSSSTATALGSMDRVLAFDRHEKTQKEFLTQTQVLHDRVELLKRESSIRAKIRKDVMKLLTTATEELDALPEELISRTNKILHSIDEADKCTADLVTIPPRDNKEATKEKNHRRSSLLSNSRMHWSSQISKLGIHPIDAKGLPVSLAALRKKLGAISHTTLLRLRNTTNEPLRLKSGLRIKSGKYIKFLHTNDPHGNAHCFHLYPGSEIPPRTEVLVVARSKGVWFPTSGIDGTIIYTNYDESWTFEITFRNDLIGNIRRCRVEAYPTTNNSDNESNASSSVGLNKPGRQNWQITKDEYDAKANNEIAISFDVLHGRHAASFRHRRSILTLKNAFLFKKKNTSNRSQQQWQRLYCVLTPMEIIFSQDENSNDKQEKISLRYVTNVQKDPRTNNVIQIHTSLAGDNALHLLSTEESSSKERDGWIKSISDAVDVISNNRQVLSSKNSQDSPNAVDDYTDELIHCAQSYIEDSVECVHGANHNTEVL